MKVKITIFLLGMIYFFNSSLYAQATPNNFWQFTNNVSKSAKEKQSLKHLPDTYQLSTVDFSAWAKQLKQAPKTTEVSKNNPELLIEIPTPKGGFQSFYLSENSVVAPGTEHLYSVKTYKGYAKDAQHIQIRCSVTKTGFQALVYDGSDSYIVEPYAKQNNTEHLIYYKKALKVEGVKCGYQGKGKLDISDLDVSTMKNLDVTTLRTYRMVFVSSGEFSQQFGGGGTTVDKTAVKDKLAEGLNLINPIFERDLGVKFSLITRDTLIYSDPATDPFASFDGTAAQGTSLEANQMKVNEEVGVSNYDIGHLFVWANTGGLASPEACLAKKAEGFSGSDASFTNIMVDYGAHEIGHQFGGDHNFASTECETSTEGFRFEPGEGSSLMAYAGVCEPAARYQATSDPFFHSRSINAMLVYIDEDGTCATTSTPNDGNATAPTSDAKLDITIPKQTPFILVGDGTDAETAGSVTYLWEQIDNSAVAFTGSPDCADVDAPLYRFRPPVSDKFRVFPEMSQVLAGNNNGVAWEKLPCVARSMNFNLITRDNDSDWGRIKNDAMAITVSNTGPFQVTVPNGGEDWTDNINTIEWDVNGTDAHCTNVDILLSQDDGATFNIIALNAPNDGEHDVTLSNITTDDARVIVQCSTGGYRSASTFFDVSNAKFSIDVDQAPLPVSLINFSVAPIKREAVNISWQTTFEQNSSHFEVERSRDGKRFSTLQTVKSVGNSSEVQTYEIIDDAPFAGLNFYRLKQVDFDGKFEYFEVRTVDLSNADSKITIYPNPTKEALTMYGLSDRAVQVSIYNQVGQRLRVFTTTDAQMDVSWLERGVYYFEFKTAQQNQIEKVIIQ